MRNPWSVSFLKWPWNLLPFTGSNREPDHIEKRLQHPSGEAPDLVLLIRIKVCGVLPFVKWNITHLRLRRIEQRVDRHLENFRDLALLHDVFDGLVDHADERRDEKPADVCDEIVHPADQL